MATSQRKNCGFSGITPSQCAEKGCCFDNSVPGYPWCFYPVTLHDNLPEEGMSVPTLRSEDVQISEQNRREPRGPNLPAVFSARVAARRVWEEGVWPPSGQAGPKGRPARDPTC